MDDQKFDSMLRLTVVEHADLAASTNSTLEGDDPIEDLSLYGTIDIKRTFTLSHLDINYIPDGFSIQTDDGPVLLETGDMIVLQGCKLRVQITKYEVVSHISINDGERIWEHPPEYQKPLNEKTELFNHSFDTATEQLQNDPLAFLYSDNVAPHGHMSTYSRASETQPGTHLPIIPISTDTQTQQNLEGNILRDLEISEEASLFTGKVIRAPLDMLDEFPVDIVPEERIVDSSATLEATPSTGGTALSIFRNFKEKLFGLRRLNR